MDPMGKASHVTRVPGRNKAFSRKGWVQRSLSPTTVTDVHGGFIRPGVCPSRKHTGPVISSLS